MNLRQETEFAKGFIKYGNIAEGHPESPQTLWKVKGVVGALIHIAKEYPRAKKYYIEGQTKQ